MLNFYICTTPVWVDGIYTNALAMVTMPLDSEPSQIAYEIYSGPYYTEVDARIAFRAAQEIVEHGLVFELEVAPPRDKE